MRLATLPSPVAGRQLRPIAPTSDLGIPPRYADADVMVLTDGAEAGTPRWRVRTWALGMADHVRRGRGLVLVGPTGTGKSMLAAGITQRARSLGISTRWVSVASWLEELETLRQVSREEWAREQERLRRVRLLVLDDLGAEDVRAWARRLDAIVSARYDARLSLLVTTNLGPDALRRTYGDRVASRLAGTCDWIELSGSDLRIAQGEVAHR
jgi:DNA replication protein DnaC